MTKITVYFSFILMLLIPNLIAQNLTIKDLDDNDVGGGNIVVNGVPTDILLELGLKITNNSATSMDIKVKKEEVSVITGSINYFCWGSCYTPDVFVSPNFITIDAGATEGHGFKGDYKSNGIEGETSIRYTFFDMNNTSDEVSVLVKYNIQTATNVGEINNSENYISKVYPIPAKDFVNIQYNFIKVSNIELKIYNLQGVKIEEAIINQKKGTYKLKNYKQGVYFYKFLQKGRVLNSGRIIFQ